MSYKSYIILEGIKGSSRDPGHVGEIEVMQLKFNSDVAKSSQKGNRGSVTQLKGVAAGRIDIVKEVDNSTGPLTVALATDATIPKGVITMFHETRTGEVKPYYTLELTKIKVVSIRRNQPELEGGRDSPSRPEIEDVGFLAESFIARALGSGESDSWDLG